MTEHFDDEKDEIIDGDITEKNDDHEDDSDYEKFCFLCHRPESQAGKMIELPNNIHICNDCMQKSFDTMTQQMNNGLNTAQIDHTHIRHIKKIVQIQSEESKEEKRRCQARD